MRNTPIITFMNKMDRETRDPLELLDELESVLEIQCAPVTWPIGMGKSFRGVYHLMRDEIMLFTPGSEKADQEFEVIKGLDNPRLAEMFPMEIEQLKMEVELVHGASHPFNLEAFLSGKQTPVFFGSAINNFGVREILNALLDWAQPPKERDATLRNVRPDEQPFSGFVFKIQANMDPAHRDRIAFLRVCSGHFERGMKIRHLRLDREIKVSSVVTFMASSREQVEEAYRHYKAADFKRHHAFLDQLLTDLDQYRSVKKTQKKARVKRAPNKEKVVSKLKYMKEEKTLKLVSINPVDIVGAQELWVYNSKTRKLYKYVADTLTGPLGVKGTSITGYDEAKSVGKTLRKPDEKLKEFAKATKVQLRKFLEDIKATETQGNGRMNSDTVLLKVQ